MDSLQSVLGQGLAVSLIVSGVAFGFSKVWPYIVTRDTEERARRYDIDILQSQAQIDAIKAQVALVDAFTAFSTVLEKFADR